MQTRVVKSTSRGAPVGRDIYINFGSWGRRTQLKMVSDLFSAEITFNLPRQVTHISVRPG